MSESDCVQEFKIKCELDGKQLQKTLQAIPFTISNEKLVFMCCKLFKLGNPKLSKVTFLTHDDEIKAGGAFTFLDQIKNYERAHAGRISVEFVPVGKWRDPEAKTLDVHVTVILDEAPRVVMLKDVPFSVGNKKLLMGISQKVGVGNPTGSRIMFNNGKSIYGSEVKNKSQETPYTLRDFIEEYKKKKKKTPKKTRVRYIPTAVGGGVCM